MADRKEHDRNGKAGNPDAKVPLSSYLRCDSRDEASDGWQVFSSDDETPTARTPNLSVLRQIKNFLNDNDAETKTETSSGDDLKTFRVDYPYYDSEPKSEKDSSDPVKFEPISPPEPTNVEQKRPETRRPDAELTLDAEKVTLDALDLEEDDVETSMLPDDSISQVAASPERDEIVAAPRCSEDPSKEDSQPLESESVELIETDSIEADAVEEIRQDSVPGASPPSSFVFDAKEFVGTAFQSRAQTEDATTPDEAPTPELPPEPTRSALDEEASVDETPDDSSDAVQAEAPRSTTVQREPLAIVEAPRHEPPASARRAMRRRLPIFRRFVELTKNRAKETIVKPATSVEDANDVPECRDDAIEPITTVEVVVPPCYNLEGLDGSLESIVIGGGENVPY